jgi:hypothetical protein
MDRVKITAVVVHAIFFPIVHVKLGPRASAFLYRSVTYLLLQGAASSPVLAHQARILRLNESRWALFKGKQRFFNPSLTLVFKIPAAAQDGRALNLQWPSMHTRTYGAPTPAACEELRSVQCTRASIERLKTIMYSKYQGNSIAASCSSASHAVLEVWLFLLRGSY